MHGGCDRGRDGDVMRRGEGGGRKGEVVVDQDSHACHAAANHIS